MPEAVVKAPLDLASFQEANPLLSVAFKERREELLHYDLWDNPPPWGGEWKEFFSIFSPDSGFNYNSAGLTRTEILKICPGDPDIFPQEFQYVLQCAIRDGLLNSADTHNDQTLTIGNRAVVQRNSEERLTLNLNSLKLNELVSEATSVDNINKLAEFLSIDFVRLADANQIILTESQPFAIKFLDYLGAQGSGKTFYTSEVYKEASLNPNPEECFTRNLASFLDEVICKAVDCGLLKQNEVSRRPGYKVV